MDPHLMMPALPHVMTTTPNILSSAYASRMNWIWNRGVREVPPTPPPVVTPSVGFGPGSPGWTEPFRPGLPEWIRRGISPPTPLMGSNELPEWIRQGISPPTALRGATESLPEFIRQGIFPPVQMPSSRIGPTVETGGNTRVLNPWDWEFSPTKATPEDWNKLGAELAKLRAAAEQKGNTVEIPELWGSDPAIKQQWTEALQSAGLDELGPMERDLKLKELRALLAEYEALLAEGGFSREGWSDLMARIEALRQFLNPPRGAKQPPIKVTPIETTPPKPTPAAPVAPAVEPGQLGHRIPWNGAGIGPANERKLAQLIVQMIRGNSQDYGLYQMLTGKVFELRDFARKLWELHEEGDAFAADDLLKDAIENSDPKLAQTLKDIEEWTRQAEPEISRGEARARKYEAEQRYLGEK